MGIVYGGLKTLDINRNAIFCEDTGLQYIDSEARKHK
jgi:hypothetical protein